MVFRTPLKMGPRPSYTLFISKSEWRNGRRASLRC